MWGSSPEKKQLVRWVKMAFLLCFVVITLGAYTRLVDAGLGCPDWPGCYGQLTAPTLEEAQRLAASQPLPIEPYKAWVEMVHRYFAGSLGLLIVGVFILAWRLRRRERVSLGVPFALLWVVVFQAVLGMWTVTLNLLPLVVTAHLLGGMTTLALLWWFYLKLVPQESIRLLVHLRPLKTWGVVAFVLVALQIFLGGWTSTHYAAMVCPDFPTCQSSWWPAMNLQEAFQWAAPIGPNYQGGTLGMLARVTIHWLHRIGALMVLVVVGSYGIALWRSRMRQLKPLGLGVLAILALQIMLGVINVVAQLPLFNAVLHNTVAAMLLLVVVTINYRLNKKVPV